jgi:hypothetical protein
MTNSQEMAFRTIALFQIFRNPESFESVLQVDEVKLLRSSKSRRLRDGTDSTGTMSSGRLRLTSKAKSQWAPCFTQLPHDGRFSSHC